MINKARRLHLYLGLLFAPSIIFFAFTGALQTFGLHESRKDQSYVPPAWIVQLARVHKDQRLEGPPKRPQAPMGNPMAHPHEPPLGQAHHVVLLKWFVLVMSVGLILTTTLGISMSFAYNRNRTTLGVLLAAGVLIPVLLLLV